MKETSWQKQMFRNLQQGLEKIGEIPITLNNFAIFKNTNDFTIYWNAFYNIA